jgi:uncharacterized protein (DUF2062 family)
LKEKYQKIWNQFKGFFFMGLLPAQLAVSISLGALIGTFPLIGVTSVLCFIIAWVFRLNIVIIQAVNWLVSPLQIVLIVPFYQMGKYVFGSTQHFSEKEITNLLTSFDFALHLNNFLHLQVTAIYGWLMAGLPFAVIIYVTVYYVSKYGLPLKK